MKNLSDFIQILLSEGGMIGVLAWVILCLFAWQAWKLIRLTAVWSVFLMRKCLISFGHSKYQVISSILFLFAAALFLNAFRRPLMDGWQYFEQSVLSPTYLNTDTSVWTLQVYEQELKRHVGESEFEIVKSETRKTAAAIGCSPLSIYEVAYSECRLDPFAANVNKLGDTVAFGWIQFTSAGCRGTVVAGHEISMQEVKGWGRTRNVAAMMEATRSYLVGRKGANLLPDAVAVYTAVFAPAMVGLSDEAVLYSAGGAKPANYWENVGLDGYGLEGDKIIHSGKYRDGKITIQDMRLHLALKKSLFLKSAK